MVLGTLCQLIVPFLALPGISGVHPIGEQVSSAVGVVAISSPDDAASTQYYANLFLSGREVVPIHSPVR